MRHVVRFVVGSLFCSRARGPASTASLLVLTGLASSALAAPNLQVQDPFQLVGPAQLAFQPLGHGGALAFHQQLQACAAHDPSLCLVAPALEVDELWVASSAWLRLSLDALPPPAPTTSAPEPAPRLDPRAVGGELHFRHGRELSLQITPTPARCAPLVKLTF